MKKLLSLCIFLCLMLGVALSASADAIEVVFNDPTHVDSDRTIQNFILDAINAASERIDLATFNFTDNKSADALVKAINRGVEVNIVVDEDNFGKKSIDTLMDAGADVVKATSSGLMHAKYIIIDGETVISGSANMTMGSFADDNNFMIRVDSPEIAALFTEEFEEMHRDGVFGEESQYSKPTAGVTLDDGTVVYVRFSPDDQIDDLIESLIASADESVYMLAYSFASKDIAERLKQADRDGLAVGVICEDSKAYTDGGGQCGPLAEAGLDVYVDGSDENLMHEKVIILDESVVIAGSYNFTRTADKRNDEQILVIQSEDIASLFMDEYNKILADAY